MVVLPKSTAEGDLPPGVHVIAEQAQGVRKSADTAD
jgi:hypothetical protein